MKTQKIGDIIAELRKEMGKRQEELAAFVGVTAQAVSKWENGGMPDCELLPRIADFFGVSVDSLFGRSISDYKDVKDTLAKMLAVLPEENRFTEIFELCWFLEKAFFGEETEEKTIADIRKGMKKGDQWYSSIQSDSGYTMMGLSAELPYFLLAPKARKKKPLCFKESIIFPCFMIWHRRIFLTP